MNVYKTGDIGYPQEGSAPERDQDPGGVG